MSDGFTYPWDVSAPTGSKVDIASIMINGAAIDPGTGYRVTVNSFLVDGTDRLGGEVDLDALVTYFGANSPVPPGPQNRITRLNRRRRSSAVTGARPAWVGHRARSVSG